MRKMKKILFFCAIVLVLVCSQEKSKAATAVALSEENFPGSYFRRYLAVMYDLDADGILSEEEIKEIKKMRVGVKATAKAIQEDIDNDTKPELDITGIEYLTELESLSLENWTLKGEGLDKLKKLKNLKMYCYSMEEYAAMKIPNLEKLNFGGYETNIKEFDASGLPSLKKIELHAYRDGNIRGINIQKNKKLEIAKIEITRLTKLDVTNNRKLQKLDCGITQLKKIDLSKNRQLTYFNLGRGLVKEIDLSNNVNLTELLVQSTPIKEIDISNLKKLKRLQLLDNKLERISTKNNPNLKMFGCWENKIKELDLSRNTKLEWLDCKDNKLKELDTSKLKKLEILYCGGNSIRKLDLRNNKRLTSIHVENNELRRLDLSNQKKMSYMSIYNNLMRELSVSDWALVRYYDTSRAVSRRTLGEYLDRNEIQILDLRSISSLSQGERKGLEKWISIGREDLEYKNSKITKLIVSKSLSSKDKSYLKKLAKKYKLSVECV